MSLRTDQEINQASYCQRTGFWCRFLARVSPRIPGSRGCFDRRIKLSEYEQPLILREGDTGLTEFCNTVFRVLPSMMCSDLPQPLIRQSTVARIVNAQEHQTSTSTDVRFQRENKRITIIRLSSWLRVIHAGIPPMFRQRESFDLFSQGSIIEIFQTGNIYSGHSWTLPGHAGCWLSKTRREYKLKSSMMLRI